MNIDPKSTDLRKALPWLIPTVSTAILAGAALVWTAGRPVFAISTDLPPRDVTTSIVHANQAASQVTLAGVVEPIRRATPSARIMARILIADFHEGQRVEANRVLVRLDTRDLAARHRQVRAGEEAANTALEVVEVNLRRMRSLVEAGAASQAQLEAIEVATAQARAATKSASTAIDEVDVNVSHASVTALFAGVVVQKMAEVGNIVGPGQPLRAHLDAALAQAHLKFTLWE